MKYQITMNFKKPDPNGQNQDIKSIGKIYYSDMVGYDIYGDITMKRHVTSIPNTDFYFEQECDVKRKWYIDRISLKSEIHKAARKCIHDKGFIMDLTYYSFIHQDEIPVSTHKTQKIASHKAVLDGGDSVELICIENTIYPATIVFEMASTGRTISKSALNTVFNQMIKDGVIISFDIKVL